MILLENRKALQAAVIIFGCVPVFAGLGGAIFGLVFIGAPSGATEESQVRYLSGLLFGIGLGFWSTVPRIETQGQRFGILAAIVVLGGLARGYGFLVDGAPGLPMIFGLVMELIVTPLIWLWQHRIARALQPAA